MGEYIGEHSVEYIKRVGEFVKEYPISSSYCVLSIIPPGFIIHSIIESIKNPGYFESPEHVGPLIASIGATFISAVVIPTVLGKTGLEKTIENLAEESRIHGEDILEQIRQDGKDTIKQIRQHGEETRRAINSI